MPERETLITINIVTDDDTGMYYIGEVDGIFQKEQLREFLQNYGLKGKNELLSHFAFLHYQLITEWIEIQKQENSAMDNGQEKNESR